MSVNMGVIDRVLRFAVGIVLIAFAVGVIYPGTGWNALGWIGLVPIATALFGFCPLYAVLGISTCPAKARAG
jgi:hypothetical protein